MRIIVCGGRDYDDPLAVARELPGSLPMYGLYGPHIFVHGACKVVHYDGRPYQIRNREMAHLGADLCIAFPGGRGTANMTDCAREYGISVREVPR